MALVPGDEGGGGGGPVNRPPVTSPIQLTTSEDASVTNVSALTGASDPEGGALSVVNMGALPNGVAYDAGSRTFTLDPNAYNSLKASAVQTVSVSYGVSDGANTTPHSLSWTILGANDAPIVTPISGLTGIENGATTSLNLAGLVVDPDGDALTFAFDSKGAPVSYNPLTTTITLDPGSGFEGLGQNQLVSFPTSYSVSDGQATVSGTVFVQVNGRNDAPVVSGPVAVATPEGAGAAPVTISALTNVTDPDQQNASPLGVKTLPGTLPAGVSFNPVTQSFTLDPSNTAYDALKPGESQLVSVTYAVGDGLATTNQTLNWTVLGGNDAPVAQPGFLSAFENGPAVTLDLRSLVTDPDSQTFTFTFNNPQNNPLVFDADAGTVTFTATGYEALAQGELVTFQAAYTVSDGGLSSTGQISVQLAGRNDAPILAPDAASVAEKATVTIAVLANDLDVDHFDTLTLTDVTTPAGVTATIVDNKLVVTPGDAFDLLGPGQSRVVDLTYTVRDTAYAYRTSTVQLTVTGAENGQTRTGGGGGDAMGGGALDDRLDGWAGNDTVDGGAGADTLLGGFGADLLIGGAGYDSLSGGDGADTLIGGSGNDTMAGGRGADLFEISAGGGRDMVIDFKPGEDDLRLLGVGLNSYADVMAAAVQSGADVLITASGGQIIQLNNLQLASLQAGDFLFS